MADHPAARYNLPRHPAQNRKCYLPVATEQYAFLKSSNVPTREGLQQAIDRAGFNLQLDANYQPRTSVGFVPCTLNGQKAGVEMYFNDSNEFMDSFRELAGDRDCCISFRWGENIEECACAMIASYALADSFDAVVTYESAPPRTKPTSMNPFDKLCAAIAFALGIVLFIAGIFGLFLGIRAWFNLPPVLGLIPAFAGWGAIRAVYLAWRVK